MSNPKKPSEIIEAMLQSKQSHPDYESYVTRLGDSLIPYLMVRQNCIIEYLDSLPPTV